MPVRKSSWICALRRFLRREDGASVAVETTILIPLVIWAYLAMFTIFDNYRQLTTQQKAAYTISDLISRQVTPLDADFLDGTHRLFTELSRSIGEIGLRVTVVTYDTFDEEYKVVWSRTRGGMIGLQSEDVASWSNRLPELLQDEQIILVESTSQFQPVFNVGLDRQTINNFVFTRPRYAKQLCLGIICALPTSKIILPDENAS